jgi:hypothetical protein
MGVHMLHSFYYINGSTTCQVLPTQWAQSHTRAMPSTWPLMLASSASSRSDVHTEVRMLASLSSQACAQKG